MVLNNINMHGTMESKASHIPGPELVNGSRKRFK